MANAPSRLRKDKGNTTVADKVTAPSIAPAQTETTTSDKPRDDAAIRALGIRMDKVASDLATECDKHKEVLASLSAYSMAGEKVDSGALDTMQALRSAFTDAKMQAWPIVDSGLRHTIWVDGKAHERNNPNPAKYKRPSVRVIKGKRQDYVKDVDFYDYVLSCMAHGKKLDADILALRDASKDTVPETTPDWAKKLSAADRQTRLDTLSKRRRRHLRVLKDGVELFQRIQATVSMTRTDKDGNVLPAVSLTFAEPDGEYQEAKIVLQDTNTKEAESFYASELLAYQPEKLAPGKGSLSEFRGTKQTGTSRAGDDGEAPRYTDVADFFAALRVIYDTLDETEKGKAFVKRLVSHLSKVHEVPERQEDLLLWGQTMDRMQEEFAPFAVGYNNIRNAKINAAMALLKANPDAQAAA